MPGGVGVGVLSLEPLLPLDHFLLRRLVLALAEAAALRSLDTTEDEDNSTLGPAIAAVGLNRARQMSWLALCRRAADLSAASLQAASARALSLSFSFALR